MLEDMHDGFTNALGVLQMTALLDAMQAADEFGREDGAHRAFANPREDVQLQVTNHLRRVPGRPLMILLGPLMPRAGHQLEGVQPCDALAFLFNTPRIRGIDSESPLLRLGPGLLSGCRKRHLGVRPEAQL